jgi:hypothetical protein
MENPSIKIGDGKWAVKNGKLLGYRSLKTKIAPIELDVVRNTPATKVNKNQVIESVAANIARIDYSTDPNGVLLIEPQSTNLNTNYLIKDWTGQHEKTINYGISPDGTQNSTRLENLGTSNTGTSKTYAVVSGVTYTFSIYLKLNSGVFNNNANIYIYPNAPSTSIPFSDLTSEWKRYSVTYVSSITGNQTFQIRTDVISSIEVYGVQLEAGSYATSIIPTNGTTVTRLADILPLKTGLSGYINSSKGAMLIDFNLFSLTDTINKFISLSDGIGTNNYIQLRLGASFTYRIFSGGSGVAAISTTITNTKIKALATWELNKFVLWINGVKIGETLTGNTPIGMNSFGLLNENGTASYCTGKLKGVEIYNEVPIDSECINLTTI